MIVPSSASCTEGYEPLQDLLLRQSALHVASFSDQRGKLFDLPHPRLSVITYARGAGGTSVSATQYNKLGAREYRDTLFDRLVYAEVTQLVRPGVIPRFGSSTEEGLYAKLFAKRMRLGQFSTPAGVPIYYTRKISWYVQVTPFVPQITDARGTLRAPSELKTLMFGSKEDALVAFAALNSSLFFWFVTTGSDCRNLNMREVAGFPIELRSLNDTIPRGLVSFAHRLSQELLRTAEVREMRFKGIGSLSIQCLFPVHSKPIIDEIDTVLARHYGFTEEELDFIINYDIKYRMGRDADDGDE